MPIYEFRCTKCGNVFEQIFKTTAESVSMSCPECNGEDIERVVSVTNYAMGAGNSGQQSRLETKTCGPGNSCHTLELPGHTRD